MSQLLQGVSFSLETAKVGGVVGEVCMEHLHCQRHIAFQIPDAVDSAHSPGSDELLDPELA